MNFPKLSRSATLSLSLSILAPLALSGCGAGIAAPDVSTPQYGLKGIAHGGPNPITGATVTLWATSGAGYGAAATQLGTAMTGNDGGFAFSSPLACPTAPSGQQYEEYVTVQGGNPGLAAGSVNPNYLLAAALGPCSTISSSTQIFVNEVSTVAAAFALRPFTSMSGTTVNIGAPASNNQITVNPIQSGTSCANTVPQSCVAAGLTHAFANALNLVNDVTVGGVAPTGQAYLTTPSTVAGLAPQQLVNTIANSVQACVNSTGGTAGDGSACGRLFADTTNSGTAPTNTFQALLNMAANPTLPSSTPGANVADVYGISTAFSQFYQPALTAAPNDYSMVIEYSGVYIPGQVGSISITNAGGGYNTIPVVTISAPNNSGGTQATASAGLTLQSLAVTTQPSTCSTATGTVKFSGGTSAQASTATWAYNAANTPALTVTVTFKGVGITAGPPSAVATGCTGSVLTPTYGLGDVEVTNPGSGYTAAPTVTINGQSTTTATASANYGVTSFGGPYAVALDANDNVYAASQDVSGANGNFGYVLGMSATGVGVFNGLSSATTNAIAPTSGQMYEPRALTTDTLGNLWVTQNNTGTNTVQQFSATTGALIKSFSPLTGNATGGAVLTTEPAFGIAIDRLNNVWYGVQLSTASPKLFELQQSNSYASVQFANPPIPTYQIRTVAIDSNQNIYTSNYNATADLVSVFPNTGTAAAPTYTGTLINSATFSAGNDGNSIALDASGNVWATAQGVSTGVGGLYEVSPTPSMTGVTGLNVNPASPFSANINVVQWDMVDGAGNVWIVNQNTGAPTVVQYVPGTGVASTFIPCYVLSGATTCSSPFGQPSKLAIDSAGSIWIPSLKGTMVQMLGTASPTWPQQSYGLPGAGPQ